MDRGIVSSVRPEEEARKIEHARRKGQGDREGERAPAERALLRDDGELGVGASPVLGRTGKSRAITGLEVWPGKCF